MAEEAKNIKIDDNKESKVNQRVKNMKSYFKDMKNELKKIVWPNKTQLINNTVTVLVFTVVVGAVIWIADGVFSKLVTWMYSYFA